MESVWSLWTRVESISSICGLQRAAAYDDEAIQAPGRRCLGPLATTSLLAHSTQSSALSTLPRTDEPAARGGAKVNCEVVAGETTQDVTLTAPVCL